MTLRLCASVVRRGPSFVSSEGDDFLGFVDGFEEVDRVGELADAELALELETLQGEARDEDLDAGPLDPRDRGDQRTALDAGFDSRVPEDERAGYDLTLGKRDDEIRKRLAAQLRPGPDAASREHQQEVRHRGGRHPDAFFEIHVLELLVGKIRAGTQEFDRPFP